MKVLIAYATTEGQTRKICRFCADTLVDAGCSVELLQAREDDVIPPGRFDAVILAGSIHVGAYQRSLVAFTRASAEALSRMRGLFLSVSLAAAGDDAAELADLDAIAQRFFEETGWRPGRYEQVAGAFRFTEYDFFKSWAMRWIAARKGQVVDPHADREYTDWASLGRVLAEWAG